MLSLIYGTISIQVAVLAQIGGCDLYDFVRRTLNFLLTPALSRHYNVTGQKGKECFSRLKLFQAIIGNQTCRTFAEIRGKSAIV